VFGLMVWSVANISSMNSCGTLASRIVRSVSNVAQGLFVYVQLNLIVSCAVGKTVGSVLRKAAVSMQ
jgi:hypothetical protein